MNAIVALDHKFRVDPAGAVWASTMFGPEFWDRYLEVFDRVHVIARLRPVRDIDESAVRVSSERVTFERLPFYHGPFQFLRVRGEIRRRLRAVDFSNSALILRYPQTLSTFLMNRARRSRHPFAVELVGDPWDVLGPGTTKNPTRPFARRWFTHETKIACRSAMAALYVTDSALQERYPAASRDLEFGISDVEIDSVTQSRNTGRFRKETLTFIFVGSMNQLYKGQDVLIRGFAQHLRQSGRKDQLRIIGEGVCRPYLEELARNEGIGDRVQFMGQLRYGNPILEALDEGDVFVLPSRQEGMPRAMLEAMSRGLPCIGTPVGGVPEIVDESMLVPVNGVDELASRLTWCTRNPDLLSEQSAKSIRTAERFLSDKLAGRRRAFYEFVRDRTFLRGVVRAPATPHSPMEIATEKPSSRKRSVHIAVSPAELIDRITILRLKVANSLGKPQHSGLEAEVAELEALWEEIDRDFEVEKLAGMLADVNSRLWEIEDAVRIHERDHDFGAEFISLARSIYSNNDHRAALRREINERLGWKPYDDKIHPDYGQPT